MSVPNSGVVLELLERQWIHKSLENQRSALVRSRLKEVSGSDIWHLRGKEIVALDALLVKFAV